MLLREEDDQTVVAIGQAAHAWLSGQLARAWGNRRFGALKPWEEVCLAAEQHDLGMARWDREPTLNPASGRPHSFMEMPLAVHLALWRAAPERMVTQSRYAALLVSMHGTALYERRDLDALAPPDADAVRRYLDDQRALQHDLIETLRADPSTIANTTDALVRRNQKLVFAWDWMSLALCLDWAPTSFDQVPARDGAQRVELVPRGEPFTVQVDPWPFAERRVEVRTEGRVLRGRFDDEDDMRRALALAPWRTLRFVLRAR